MTELKQNKTPPSSAEENNNRYSRNTNANPWLKDKPAMEQKKYKKAPSRIPIPCMDIGMEVKRNIRGIAKRR